MILSEKSRRVISVWRLSTLPVACLERAGKGSSLASVPILVLGKLSVCKHSVFRVRTFLQIQDLYLV